jgi:hypothetical protein
MNETEQLRTNGNGIGYIKAEAGKNGKFEFEIEIKNCNSIECLSFAGRVAEEILNNIARGNKRVVDGYKRALIGAIDVAEFNNHE